MECFNLIDKHDIKKYNIDQIQFSSHINKKKNKMSYIYSISTYIYSTLYINMIISYVKLFKEFNVISNYYIYKILPITTVQIKSAVYINKYY
ncbi:hypothetical protein PFAG_02122 [Plasmodium falciparum Santa Lucia]|uniref:Uncharacterized protein n=1 Tax=Plasmodium falciparum Santa Lucia TaxID=478859 RepID=W7FRV5_PLAFA|nr:hypothetical protein PFAG_02122 [Plasmodium falciparum Santa Lucia]